MIVVLLRCGRIWIAALGIVSVLGSAGCQSPYYADRGAALGGLTGAGLGAAVGKSHGDTALGAVLGGAAGALTGAAVGGAIDDVQARNDALIAQQLGRPIQGATPIHDVIAMSQAGLSDEVIVQHLRSHGLDHGPTAQDLIQLRQQGVSNLVLQAMQELGATSAVAPAVYQVPAPARLAYEPAAVVVEEHHYVVPPPRYWHGPPPRYFHPHPRGVHWGVSFGR